MKAAPAQRRRGGAPRRGGPVLLLLLLDFDGTLSPLAPAPELARLPSPLMELLKRLARRPQVRVGVISGRALADVEGRIRVKGLYYGGNHGLDMKGPGLRFRHPGAFRLKGALREAAAVCREKLADVPGALVEAKTLGVALHERRVPARAAPLFRRRMAEAYASLRGRPLRWLRGRRVWEILPRVDWDKGRAARLLFHRLGRPFTVVVGDDATDEDMFRAFPRGLTICVGPAAGSCARFAVPSQKNVLPLLRGIENAIGGTSHEDRR